MPPPLATHTADKTDQRVKCCNQLRHGRHGNVFARQISANAAANGNASYDQSPRQRTCRRRNSKRGENGNAHALPCHKYCPFVRLLAIERPRNAMMKKANPKPDKAVLAVFVVLGPLLTLSFIHGHNEARDEEATKNIHTRKNQREEPPRSLPPWSLQ